MAGAVAIELIHNFSLAPRRHDRRRPERRHRSTVWAEFGVGPAVIGGDALATPRPSRSCWPSRPLPGVRRGGVRSPMPPWR